MLGSPSLLMFPVTWLHSQNSALHSAILWVHHLHLQTTLQSIPTTYRAVCKRISVNTIFSILATFPMMFWCFDDLLPAPHFSHWYPGIISRHFFFLLWHQTKHGNRKSLQHCQKRWDWTKTWSIIFQLSCKNVSLSCVYNHPHQSFLWSIYEEIVILIPSDIRGKIK